MSQAINLPVPATAARLVTGGGADLSSIIARIEDAIDFETKAIRSDVNFDIAGSNERKSRHLYDLTRSMKGANDLSENHRIGLDRLREKLAVNEIAIQAHLNAVGEVAAILQTAIQNNEADGTYSADEFGTAYAR